MISNKTINRLDEQNKVLEDIKSHKIITKSIEEDEYRYDYEDVFQSSKVYSKNLELEDIDSFISINKVILQESEKINENLEKGNQNSEKILQEVKEIRENTKSLGLLISEVHKLNIDIQEELGSLLSSRNNIEVLENRDKLSEKIKFGLINGMKWTAKTSIDALINAIANVVIMQL